MLKLMKSGSCLSMCMLILFPLVKEILNSGKFFYDQLDSLISKSKNKDNVIILGDFNAKTGTGYKFYKENMGKFGKGNLNSNGEHLLEFANRNRLILTNTLFRHKLAHTTK